MTTTGRTTDTLSEDDELEDFKLFEDDERHWYIAVFIIVTTLSVCANIAAIYAISKRNYRRLQKTCTICLALADILTSITIGVLNVAGFWNRIKEWTLGPFFCGFLPMAQMAGVLASSVALMFIAVDRYRNVVFALSKRWNPRMCFCMLGAVLIGLTCFGIAAPLCTYFEILEYSTSTHTVYVCIMNSYRKVYVTYHGVMSGIIFLPLFFTFLWSYYKIAVLVWKHRRPFFLKKNIEERSSTSDRTLPEVKTVNKPKTQDDIRVERKIRTFKIIVTLMIVFILFRLPYFAIQMLKSVPSSLVDSQVIWHLNFCSMIMQSFSCFLNPLLYTFLQWTLKVLKKIRRFIKKYISEICCFCCSRSEFESFERENPFVMDNYEMKRNSKVRFEDEGRF